jgi:hypothetical protein
MADALLFSWRFAAASAFRLWHGRLASPHSDLGRLPPITDNCAMPGPPAPEPGFHQTASATTFLLPFQDRPIPITGPMRHANGGDGLSNESMAILLFGMRIATTNCDDSTWFIGRLSRSRHIAPGGSGAAGLSRPRLIGILGS